MKKLLLSLSLVALSTQTTMNAFSLRISCDDFAHSITDSAVYKTAAEYSNTLITAATNSPYKKVGLVVAAALLTKYLFNKKVDPQVHASLENADQQLGYNVVLNVALGSLTAYGIYKCFNNPL